MKRVNFFFLFILTFINTENLLSQSGWFWQNPLPQGNNLTSVKIVNPNTAYAVGYSGTIMKSTDLGSTWSYQMINPNYHYLSVFFMDINTGFTAGYYFGSFTSEGVISRTTNGGSTWNNFLLSNYDAINSIWFINVNIGFAVDGSGNIIMTTDNGSNWTTVFTNAEPLYAIQFTSSSTGYASGGNGRIFKTVNGGLNWNLNAQLDTASISALNFIDVINGYASSPPSHLFKTTNGGLNWSQDSLVPCCLISFFFMNMNTGFESGGYPGYGNQSLIYKTIDGGNNWTPQHSDTGTYINSIYSNDNSNLIAVGNGGTIFKSTDVGDSWLIKTQGYYRELLSVCFVDANTGFAGGFDFDLHSGNFGIILKTTDGGLNWSKNYFSLGSYRTFSFINSTTGYAAGGIYAITGVMAKTTNAGMNWVQQNYIGTSVCEIIFTDLNTGYLACSTGSILKTTDGGNNWYPNYLAHQRLHSLFCLNSNLVYAVGDSGFVYKTTNGGSNWITLLTTSFLKKLNSVYFINNNTGYIAADSGTILKTTNAGMTWIKSTFDTCINYMKIKFSNANTGYVCGTEGNMLKTSNGGANWLSQSTPTNNDLFSLFLVNSSTGYAVGHSGTIIKTTTGGEPIGIRPVSQRIPQSYFLYQNYPNPFNPKTKIKFSIPIISLSPFEGGLRGMAVKLFVYDLLGREVATLINQQLQPGTYEVEWDGSNYSSGVYFYKLTAGDYNETKKMVLGK